MSTRTNIIVKIGETTIYLYRHCDGYLVETGADLLVKTRAALNRHEGRCSDTGAATALVRALMAEHYVYEITSGLHGDIEHLYTIRFERANGPAQVSIRHEARSHGGTTYSVDEFANVVNQARKHFNARIADLKASSSEYADCIEYAEL